MKRMAAVIGTAFAIGLLSMPATMDVLAADITEARAKEIAMEHAGVSEKKIPFIKAELDHEDGRQVYEIEFVTDDCREFDYEVDPVSGKILSYDYDAGHYDKDAGKGGNTKKITLGKAKEIALKQAGV